MAIDPGPVETGWLLFDGKRVLDHGIDPTAEVLARIYRLPPVKMSALGVVDISVIIESIESYGMPVGKEVLETVHWAGRMFEAATACGYPTERMTRKAVKIHLCGTLQAKDSNVRQALTDRFGATKEAAVGSKAAQGPLYGLRAHEFAALALAVTWLDRAAQPKQAAR